VCSVFLDKGLSFITGVWRLWSRPKIIQGIVVINVAKITK
jgi:hypothetical protein